MSEFSRRSLAIAGLLVLTLFWGRAVSVSAQEQEVAAAGKPVFEQHCAVCHGQDGKGGGVASNMLTVKPADLTLLSKKNGDKFPFWRVYGMIDGREEIKGHGSRDMPIWGAEFRVDAGSSPTAQSQVRGRILELVYYLQSIQAK